MRRFIIVPVLLMFGTILFAQDVPYKMLIRFTDKNNSPYSISDPSQFLSAKALARRNKQGITIKYNDLPVSPAYVDSILSTGVSLYCQSKWFNSVTIYTNNQAALNKIMSFPFVLKVDTIARYTKVKSPTSFSDKMNETFDNSLLFQNNYKYNNENNIYNYGESSNQIKMIGANFLHNNGFNGKGMTIAIIDAGFYYADTLSAFDSLWANNQILGTKDFVNPGANVFREHYHGMMVLSTIGANLPGKMIGDAPKASFWLLCSEDVNSENIIEEYNWASAAEFADSVGADVINTSLGYTTFDSSWMSHSYADMNGHTCPASIAAATAASKGMIVCASAGNSAQYPWHYIGTPADADSIITVGGVDANGNYAYFSSTGPTADGRIKPTVAAQALATVLMSNYGYPITENGTSFSSPIIAGATACLWQAFPNFSNMQIIDAIKKSASQYSNPDSLLGYGIPNFSVADLILSGAKISNINSDNNLNIFPNPFSNIINIIFFSNELNSFNIDIYDVAGKIVLSEKDLNAIKGYNYHFLNSNCLTKGIYFIKVYSDKLVFTNKIVK